MNFASVQARKLGLSSEYQPLACWYFQSGGSDFHSYVASFFPHLSADASRDFFSGSSLFLSALCSLAFAPPHSSGAPVFPPLSAPLPSAPPSASAMAPVTFRPRSFSSTYSAPPSAPPLGFSTPSVRPPPGFSTPSASLFPSFAPSVPHSDPSPAPSAPSAFSFRHPAPIFPAFPGVAASAVPVTAPAVPMAAPAVPAAASSLFRPFADSGPLEPPVSSSAPAFVTSAVVPGVAFGVPPVPPWYPMHSTPSAFVFSSSEDHFDPNFPDAVPRDPDVPVPPPVPDSFRTEMRRMYAYLVDLFPQVAGSPSIDPPPRALFEEFFTHVVTPQQSIYLNWFARVRTALSEANSRLASFLASGLFLSALSFSAV